MADIKLTIRSNFGKAASEIKSFGQLTERESNRIEKFKQKFVGNQIDTFIQKNQRAAAAVLATRGPLEAATVKQAGLRREIERLIRGGIDPQDEALKQLQREYAKTSRHVDAHARAQQASTQAVRNATIAIGALTGAAALVGSKGVRAYSEYSKSLANVNTLISINKSEMDALDDKLSELSVTYATHKTELSGGVYQALSAGASSLGDALEIVEASAILGKGALIENAAAVDIVTTAMNAYGAETSKVQDVIDTFFTIVEGGKITGDQISQTIGKSISVFASAKLPVEELGAGIAALTKLGVPAAETTTKLNAVVAAFLQPSAAMSQELQKIGFTSGAALLEAHGLGGAMKFLIDVTGGASDKISELIPSITAAQGVMALTSQDGKILSEALEEFAIKSGSANEAMRVQTEGFAAGAYTVDQARIVLQNLAIELGQKLLPPLASAVEKFVTFATEGDRLQRLLDLMIPTIAGLAAGLSAFIVISKIIKLVKAFTTAQWSLNAAMAANPIGIIATGIGLVIAGAIALYRNWDKIMVFFETTIVKLSARFAHFAEKLKLGWSIAINAIKSKFIDLAVIIIDRVLKAANIMIMGLSKLPFIGDKFTELNTKVGLLRQSLYDVRDAAHAKSDAIIKGAQAEYDAIRRTQDAKIKMILAEGEARRAAEPFDTAATVNLAAETGIVTAGAETAATMTATDAALLPSGLGALGAGGDEAQIIAAEQAALQKRLANYDAFMQRRVELGLVDFEGQLAAIEEQREAILASDALTNQQKFDMLVELDEKKRKLEEDYLAFQKKMREKAVQSTADTLGNISELIGALGKDSHEAAVAQKALSAAQAAINSYLAFTQVIADTTVPTFVKVFAGMAVLTAGLAQQAKILTTPIPSAEIGGQFIVPDSYRSSRGDSQMMRVNPGEQVSVAARGENLGRSLHITTTIDRRVIYDIVTTGIETGNIVITPGDNMRQVTTGAEIE